MANITQESLRLLKEAQSKAIKDDRLMRAYDIAAGLVNYDLEPVAKTLYADMQELTPLRNKIPRVPGRGGNATNWKAITAINPNNVTPGIAEGRRGGVIAQTLKDYLAAYKTIGQENSVTFEAEEAAEGFDDARARVTVETLQSTMIEEEHCLLGGNNSLALGTPTTPTLADVSTGGAIPETTDVYVSVVALTHYGFRLTTVAAGCPGQISRPNADGTTEIVNGGNSQISAAANITTATDASNEHRILASTPVIAGAVAYVWYWGATAGAAQKIGLITTINSASLTTAAGSGTQAANDAKVAADYSKDSLVPDGLITICAGPGPEVGASESGALVKAQATGTAGVGTKLTSDGAGGITEIEEDLKAFWDLNRLGPDVMYVSGQELKNITAIIIKSGGAPLIRFNMDVAGAGAANIINGRISAGVVVGTYLNKYAGGGGKLMQIVVHPNLTPGTIVYYSDRVTYALGIPNVLQVKTRREYYQTEWPLKSRQYEYGVYVTQVLQCYFPPAFGIRQNIPDGN